MTRGRSRSSTMPLIFMGGWSGLRHPTTRQRAAHRVPGVPAQERTRVRSTRGEHAVRRRIRSAGAGPLHRARAARRPAATERHGAVSRQGPASRGAPGRHPATAARDLFRASRARRHPAGSHATDPLVPRRPRPVWQDSSIGCPIPKLLPPSARPPMRPVFCANCSPRASTYSASTPRTARRTTMRRASTPSAKPPVRRACTPASCSICKAPRFAWASFEEGHATLETGASVHHHHRTP